MRDYYEKSYQAATEIVIFLDSGIFNFPSSCEIFSFYCLYANVAVVFNVVIQTKGYYQIADVYKVYWVPMHIVCEKNIWNIQRQIIIVIFDR